MEKQALQNALQRLQASLNVVEVVTDASTSIKKLLGEYT
jgi:ribonuclease HI